MAGLAFRRGSRARAGSLAAVPPPTGTPEYSAEMARTASRMLYRSPLGGADDLPVYILDSAAFPDTRDVNYDVLLPYVLARLPDEEQLIGGRGYDVVFFAGGSGQQRARANSNSNPVVAAANGVRSARKGRPGWAWLLQAHHVLSRAMRKRLRHLYLVHERRWVRVVAETFSTVVSPKSRRKLVHCSTLTALALHLPIEDLLIPPTAYDRDRHLTSSIHSPYATGRRAFSAVHPLPVAADGTHRLPRVLRETTCVLLDPENVKTEGLFRVNARALTLDVLKEAYDRGQKFIVWKEGEHTITFSHWKEGHGEVAVGPTDQLGGYGVYTAAGLVKMWYSGLLDPLFPQSSYSFLEKNIDVTEPVEISTVLEIISADWSPLTKESKMILTMHLIPMLAEIAKHSSENKMSASNLSLCFAPALLCGPDPIEDAKMARTISMLIESAVENWYSAVAAAVGMSDDRFSALLKTPVAPADREDPLSGSMVVPSSSAGQEDGIVLLDKEDSDDSSDGVDPAPPLPPRAATQADFTDTAHLEKSPLAIKRKPAPPIPAPPPRYSTIAVGPMQDPSFRKSLPPYTFADPLFGSGSDHPESHEHLSDEKRED